MIGRGLDLCGVGLGNKSLFDEHEYVATIISVDQQAGYRSH
jgi:hypothetical protein